MDYVKAPEGYNSDCTVAERFLRVLKGFYAGCLRVLERFCNGAKRIPVLEDLFAGSGRVLQ